MGLSEYILSEAQLYIRNLHHHNHITKYQYYDQAPGGCSLCQHDIN